MKSQAILCVLLASSAWALPLAGMRTVPAEEVCATTRDLVQRAAAARGLSAQVQCAQARAINVPTASLHWSLADEGGMVWRPGPARVVLRLQAEGARERDVGVPVTLSLASSAWVARHDLRAGDTVTAQALELRENHAWPVGHTPEPAATTAPSGRARAPIKAGDAVRASQLTLPQQRLQGDAVTVAFRARNLTVEMPAVLVSHAQIGQPARVQLQGRRDTLQGVLVDGATVVVER
jgi:flagella basal body P-ring formation protein FlgA